MQYLSKRHKTLRLEELLLVCCVEYILADLDKVYSAVVVFSISFRQWTLFPSIPQFAGSIFTSYSIFNGKYFRQFKLKYEFCEISVFLLYFNRFQLLSGKARVLLLLIC